MSFVLDLADANSTQKLGKLLGQLLPVGSVIFLEGDLGAGKTTLVQGIGYGLGIGEQIVSPTFSLIDEYTDGRLPLYHLDLYRLSSTEIEALHPEIYWEGVEVQPGITAIEWAQLLPDRPPNYLKIQLFHTLDRQRQAKLQLVGNLAFDLDRLLNF
jgi:tRNA threonylcarbamoyladenosine biosynthesis protein TsaE